jgi:hypothetical protein
MHRFFFLTLIAAMANAEVAKSAFQREPASSDFCLCA